MERLHPEDKPRVLRALHRAVAGGARTWAGYYRFRCKDGSCASVLDHGYILKNPEGKPARVVGGIRDISERRKAEEALKNSRRQLRALSARLQSAREEERANVAREIHDELGQMLTAAKLNLDWVERGIGEREHDRSLNPLLDRVVECSEMIESAIQSVQRIATDLRPGVLDHLGLAVALQQEAHRFQKRSGIACEFHLPPNHLGLPREVATAVFRIFQESLTNVARHAQATTVRVTLEADAEQVVLQVEDNGRGIRPSDVVDSRSLGLLGMRERAWVLGGDVAIEPVTPALAEALAATVAGATPALPHEMLSNRALQVLRLVALGKPLKEIAAELCLSEKTIGTYRLRISQKLGLSTNVELARYAMQHKLVE